MRVLRLVREYTDILKHRTLNTKHNETCTKDPTKPDVPAPEIMAENIL